MCVGIAETCTRKTTREVHVWRNARFGVVYLFTHESFVYSLRKSFFEFIKNVSFATTFSKILNEILFFSKARVILKILTDVNSVFRPSYLLEIC